MTDSPAHQESSGTDALIHLRSSGVSLILSTAAGRAAGVVHWGDDLGPLSAPAATAVLTSGIEPPGAGPVDAPVHRALLPQLADGWLGRPGIEGCRPDGSAFSPRFRTSRVSLDGTAVNGFHEVGAATVVVSAEDPDAGLRTETTVEMTPQGLVRIATTLTNSEADDFILEGLQHSLPIPVDAAEILDLAGRWGLERFPQRTPIGVGTHLRENRRGRTGADSAYLMHVGTPGFSFQQGEIRAVHLAWSGNHRHYVERLANGSGVIGAGELLLAGEGRLPPGGSYTSPDLYAAHGHGLDDVARRFHRLVREDLHPLSFDRPVTLNVWEAVGFDHRLPKLLDLAEVAASLGVERYVLDDGWFGSRRDDTSGLGDWTVSAEAWPHGLHPLVDRVRSLGMQFGLWFEPEMVNEDSDLARAHPDWVMAPGRRMPLTSRHQQVLNLTIPAAWEHILTAITAIIEEYRLDYIKWDHNRDLIESATRSTGAAASHAQTLAVYRMLDALNERFPRLEIESCSSGGSRVDLGILRRCSRVWVSDCIDSLERQTMNRWTAQLLPLEFLGSHIASSPSKTTGRRHSLSFRAATALFGHLGIEWDVTTADSRERDELARWISFHKDHRELLFSGELVRVDRTEDSLQVGGVVSADRSEALFSIVSMHRSPLSPRGMVRLAGLDPHRTYRVRPVLLGEEPGGLVRPPWFGDRDRGTELPGSALMAFGLHSPCLFPEQALVLQLSTVD